MPYQYSSWSGASDPVAKYMSGQFDNQQRALASPDPNAPQTPSSQADFDAWLAANPNMIQEAQGAVASGRDQPLQQSFWSNLKEGLGPLSMMAGPLMGGLFAGAQGAGGAGAGAGMFGEGGMAAGTLGSTGAGIGTVPWGAGAGAGAGGGGLFSGLSDWASSLFQGGSPQTTSSAGGAAGAAGGLAGMSKWISPLMSVGSGLYGLSLAEQQKNLAQQALQRSSPWESSGGMAGAGSALTNVIQGNFTNDPGFMAAQRAAAATSSTQPGGFAAQAAANAALQYQNQRIQALSGPAGTQFSPAQGYATAGQINQGANSLASSSLGSIGYGVGTMTGQNQMPPWLQNWFIQNNMRSTTPVQV